MRAVIQPGSARGTVAAPPSKSMAHRLLICAALTEGETVIRGVDRSEDILATMDCLSALGASLSWEENAVRVQGVDPRRSAPAVLRCRESGSTLRFMIPLCLVSGSSMRLKGSETLLSRPLSVYEDLCRAQRLTLTREEGGLRVQGRLTPGEYSVPGNISSQFVSGLLFALPLLPEDSVIRLIPPVESRSYLNLTLHALNSAGIPAGCVTVTGLRTESLQGDRVYQEYFRLLRSGPAELDVTDCPDLAPVLFAVAALCHGAGFTGVRRLRFKESDRGAVMAQEMAKFGIHLEMREDRIVVPAGNLSAPGEPLDSHNDHRIAMALSVLCTRTGGEIRCAEAVRKSFPDYWERLRSLGIDISIHD